ncbi:MAG: hypothetical protein IT379_38050 [Deltaproteobacteria bacterium]|nr:hypothetical protein [Deltaproteobacteria bacterium]
MTVDGDASAFLARLWAHLLGGAPDLAVVVRPMDGGERRASGEWRVPAFAPEQISIGPDELPSFVAGLGTRRRQRLLVVALGYPGADRSDVTDPVGEALADLPADIRCAIWLPATALESRRTAAMRSALRGRARWIVWLRDLVNPLFDIHALFDSALVVTGGADDGCIRLVDLRRARTHDDAIDAVARCGVRGGGEVENTIVLRKDTVALDDAPWTFLRFSRVLSDSLADTRALGPTVTLGDVADIARAVHRFERARGGAAGRPGLHRAYDARSLREDGSLGDDIGSLSPEKMRPAAALRACDVLVRTIRRTGEPLRAAVVTDANLPAVAVGNLVRVRFREPPRWLDLLTSYLGSERVTKRLDAASSGSHVHVAVLRELPIPVPNPEVLDALDRLQRDERHHLRWAAELQEARRGLFQSRSYRDDVPRLLAVARESADRVEAAHFAGTLEALIRDRFPHPFALRWDVLATLPHGEKRFGKTLECAEHWFTYLAILATTVRVQLGKSPLVQPSWVDRGNRLTFDFGKVVDIVRSTAALCSKHPDPLELAVPELARLHEAFCDTDGKWTHAVRDLMDVRNKQAHLTRLPPGELADLCRRMSADLAVVFDACRFVTATPLVHVLDYRLDPMTGGRLATYERLVGISAAARRETALVQRELPRGGVGILDRKGQFHSLAPWLLREACESCKRPETFVFSKMDGEDVSWVAFETGHPRLRSDMAARVRAAIGSNDSDGSR